ncbi:MAG: winged helix DNA-binding protein [Kiritimatiellae bacterium]|nr:winged helix DNA-binding protein [Kiritimatiellia bacterium]
MTTQQNAITREVRTRLIEVAGRTTQDLGLGRIVGQVLGDIYLTDGDSSLDDIGRNLGLSKAAVSIAARQLESLGLLQRIWKKADRKNYYRIVDHLGLALRQGVLELVRGKLRTAGAELDHAEELLRPAGNGGNNSEVKFLQTRLNRAKQLRRRATRILNNPIMKMLGL